MSTLKDFDPDYNPKFDSNEDAEIIINGQSIDILNPILTFADMVAEGRTRPKYDKVVMVGAQGTGKTTILSALQTVHVFCFRQFQFITEVVRELVKTNGIKINEQGDDHTQKLIFNEYLRKFKEAQQPYISDRGLIDVYSYTQYLYGQKNVSWDCMQEIDASMNNFYFGKQKEKKTGILHIYFPIEFGVVDDGVRSVNEDFRTRIDDLIVNNLNQYVHEDFIFEVSGSANLRFQNIFNVIYQGL